jgi:2',3'-cyclic-nucleotide 2'-phosphodiesterase / 3'-nucleotidase / 5'-nucleotidase
MTHSKRIAGCGIAACLLLSGLSARAAVVDLVPSADTCVVKGQLAVNNGTATSLFVASQSAGAYQDERVWLRFPLMAEVPPGATIRSAELRLYVFDADDADPLDASAHGCDDDAWQENTLTWANQPAFHPVALATVTLAPAADRLWYAWDVTAFVTNQWAGDRTASLVVKAATEGADPWRSYKVNSREFGKPAFRPVLRVTYEGSWPTTDPIRILHMNDAHARIVPHEIDVPEEQDIPRFERVGGAAWFGAKLLEQKAACPDSLVLDAGDMSEGNPVGDLRGNGAMIDFYKLLDAKLKALGGRGIDAVVVGNHDVRARSMIDNLATNGAFAVLSMNICHKGTLTPYFTPFVTVNVAGRKVGILGYTNDESSYLDGDTADLIDVVPCDWSDTNPGTIDIKPYVQQLRAQGCDFVVLLSHMGQSRLCTDEDALLEYDGDVPPPEVVVSGHWHSWTETAWQPSQLRYRTTVVESGSYLQYLGDLTVNGDGRYLAATQHVIRCDQIIPDAEIANLVTNLIAEYNATLPPYGLDQVIGYSAVDLRMDKDKWWTPNEYPWSAVNAAGAWICDAMRWKSVQAALSCDLAIQSGGGIRRDVPAGPITYLEIYECYPWADDDMVRVQLTGQQIRDTIEDKRCGASISEGWTVYADEGVVTNVLFNGSPINLAGSYNVAISGYMYLHEGFATLDPTPEYIGHSIRQSIIDYTAQFGPENPLTLSGPRYILNTEMAGVFDAVVTLPVDAEDEAYYEALFVRLLRASDNTVRWRGRYADADLVRADGTINPDHVFAETMLYRSHLGFADGLLRNGDIIRIHGEGGFHAGLPQIIDQAGIRAHAQEWEILGRDESLAQPAFMPDIASFWNEEQEGRYVRFYARKTTGTQVRDAAGQTITIHKAGGYYTQPLPGNTGDLLELTGVSGSRNAARRFRCHTVRLASAAGVTAFPPWSRVRPVTPSRLSATPCLLQADAGAFDGTSGGGLVTVASAADSQVVEGSPNSNYGTATYMYVQSAPPTDTYRNERAWMRFDLTGRVAAGTAVQSAVLRVYCWRATGPDLDVAACGSANDLWTETGITWASQPAFGAAEDSVTLRAGQANVWYEWDVTGLVSNSVAAGDLAVSVVLKAATEGLAAVHTFGFDGREYQGGAVAPELKITVAAPPGGPATGLRKVDFLYRHAADARAWSGWQPAGTVSSAPWQLEFACPAGVGHYEFYSQATDATGAVEPAPLLADAAMQFAPVETDPLPPHDPAATALATDPLGLSHTLSVQVADPNGDTLDVSFYDSTGALIGVCTDVASGQTASVYWFRAPGCKATGWYAIARDPTGRETRSADFALDGGTLLAPGDITILGYRTSAPDGFAFVTWRPLPADTVLGFWDHSANADGTFRLGEQRLTWTAPAGGVAAGTVVAVSCPAGGPAVATAGTVDGSLDGLMGSGDQVFVGSGGTFPPSGDGPAFAYDGTLLHGLNIRGDWLMEGDPEDQHSPRCPPPCRDPTPTSTSPRATMATTPARAWARASSSSRPSFTTWPTGAAPTTARLSVRSTLHRSRSAPPNSRSPRSEAPCPIPRTPSPSLAPLPASPATSSGPTVSAATVWCRKASVSGRPTCRWPSAPTRSCSPPTAPSPGR